MKGRRPKTQAIQGPTLTTQPPDTLRGKIARERWASTILDLDAFDRALPSTCEAVLSGFCSACELLADAEAELEKSGMLVDGGREGVKRSPALGAKLSALSAIRAYAVELGLTPGSAGRLPPALPPEDPETEMYDEF